MPNPVIHHVSPVLNDSHGVSRKSLRGWGVLAGVALFLSATVAFAQVETEPAPAPASNRVDSVGENLGRTKQALEDLELLQRGLTPNGTAGIGDGLPELRGMRTEESTLPAPGSTAAGATPADQQRAWAEQNWLLEGMRQQTLSDEERLQESQPALALGRKDGDQGTNPATNWLLQGLEAQQRVAAGGQADESDPRVDGSRDSLTDFDADEEANPLDAFMAQWLSSRDSETLKRGNRDRTAGANGSLAVDGLSGVLSGWGTTSADGPGSFDRNDPRSRERDPQRVFGSLSSQAPETNPFLVAMGLDTDRDSTAESPLSALPATTPFSTPATVNSGGPNALLGAPAATSGASETSAQTATNGASDNRSPWRPTKSEDEKYFPRLNRF